MAGLVVCAVSGLSGPMHMSLYRVGFAKGLSGANLARGWPLVVASVSGGLLTVTFVDLRRRHGTIVDIGLYPLVFQRLPEPISVIAPKRATSGNNGYRLDFLCVSIHAPAKGAT